MKIIFLDIDGVLNTTESLYDRRFTLDKPFILSSGKEFNDNLSYYAVRVLNDIIKQNNAKVVISSTWRVLYSLDELREILDLYKFKGEIISSTPMLWKKRGIEIKKWLQDFNKEVEGFVILDDDTDMCGLVGHLVHTKIGYSHYGLHYDLLEKSSKILSNKGVKWNYIKHKMKRFWWIVKRMVR